MAIHEQDRQLEEQRLAKVVAFLQQQLEQLEDQLLDTKEEVKQLRRNFWSDISVNTDNWDDLLESYADITQKSLSIAERERTYTHVNRLADRLRRMADSPYFGRMDFIEEGKQETDQLYIGIGTVLEESSQRILIYDWRAPISSMYYDYPLGSANYTTPDGRVCGEIVEKRQYVIRGGKMLYAFDTGEHVGDEVLQQVLGKKADTQMQSIVATIQREQNQIIRESNKKIVVVSGVAGSGKTSVAMQRIAYLLYQYRNRITSDNILLLSPNPLFKRYIANVLPELGESNIMQSTLHEYIEVQLGSRYQIEHPYTYMENRLLEQRPAEQQLAQSRMQFKGSIDFYTLIERYSKYLERTGCLFRSIRFRGKIIISAREIHQQFYSCDPSIKLHNRWEGLVDWLLKRLRRIEQQELQQDWVTKEVELLGQEEYQQVYDKVQKQARNRGDSFDYERLEEEQLRKIVVRRYFSRIRKAIKQHQFIDYMRIYKQLITDPILIAQLAEGIHLPSDLDAICQTSAAQMEKNTIPYEDVAAFFLLKQLIDGFHSYLHILYLLVDEAQDYTAFQMKLLTRLFPRAKWTILGDPNQAIMGKTIDMSRDIPRITEQNSADVLVYHLQRSYRSTLEIVHFTQAILPQGSSIIPFERHGEHPQVVVVEDERQLRQGIIATIEQWRSDGMQTIAVLCKTEAEARLAHASLQAIDNIQLIHKDVKEYSEGALVIPVYLAKGLEFDAVIVYNASDTQYASDAERFMLYTAATRAMHILRVYALGQPSPFLAKEI